jgi:outer membrane protein assembly factor BamB
MRQALLLIILASLLLLALAVAIGTRPGPPDPLVITAYHGGADRAGTMPGPGPVGTTAIGWEIQRAGPMPFGLMPVARGDRLFVADGAGDVSALQMSDGAVLWTTRAASPVTGSPVVAGDLLVVGTEGGAIVAYDTSDGVQRWQHDAGSAVRGALSVADGILIAPTEDGTILALRADSGEVVWTFAVGAATTRGPAIGNRTMFVPDAAGRLTAVDMDTRTPRWEADLGDGEVGTPAVSHDMVYAVGGINGGGRHQLVALAVVDGAERWSFETDDGGQILVGAVAGGKVYAVGEDGIVYALQAASGAESWR